jgi:hypothetical protein
MTEAELMEVTCDALYRASNEIADLLEGRQVDKADGALEGELETLHSRRQTYTALLSEGATEMQPAIEAIDRQINDLWVAASRSDADRYLVQLRDGMRLGLAGLDELCPGLLDVSKQLGGGDWREPDNLAPAWLSTIFWAGAEAWLDPKHRVMGCAWIDVFVHSVTVTDKKAEVKLNL